MPVAKVQTAEIEGKDYIMSSTASSPSKDILSSDFIQFHLRKYFNNEGVDVTDHSVRLEPSGLGAHFGSSVALVQAALEERKVVRLFIKRLPNTPSARDLLRGGNFFAREAALYNTLVPDMQALCRKQGSVPICVDVAPACVYACGEKPDEGIVLENLLKNGYRTMPLEISGHDLEHCKLVMKSIGMFHALTFALKLASTTPLTDKYKLFNDVIYDKYPDDKPHYFTMSFDVIGSVVKDTHPEVYELLMAFKKRIVSIGQRLVVCDGPLSTICHGDLWNNNIMFKYDADNNPVNVKFVDYQCVRYAPVTTDLAQYLYTSTPPAFREKHLDAALDAYYDALELVLRIVGHKTPPFTLQDLKKDFQEKRILGLVYASPTYQNMYAPDEDDERDDEKVYRDKLDKVLREAVVNVCKELEDDIKREIKQ